MCPRLFQIGPFTVYGYGLMLALGFIAGSYLLVSEFKRRKLDPNIANNITLIASLPESLVLKFFTWLRIGLLLLSIPPEWHLIPGAYFLWRIPLCCIFYLCVWEK